MKTNFEIIEYLRNSGYFRAFINACMNEYKRTNNTVYRPIKSIVNPSKTDVIMNSFSWSDSLEGYTTWQERWKEFSLWRTSYE